MPQLSVDCAAPASLFAYPKATEVVKEKAKEKVASLSLSLIPPSIPLTHVRLYGCPTNSFR